MTVTRHMFEALHMSDPFGPYVVAACSCGWTSSYTHAFEKYAQPDHDHHVTAVAEPNRSV